MKITRNRRLVAAFATPVAILAAGALVLQGSYAAFSGSTSNAGDNWTAGNVVLVNDVSGTSASGAALWSASGSTAYSGTANTVKIKPGDTSTKCIVITSNGNLPSTVKFYLANETATASLDNYIKLNVTQGTGSVTNGSCSGFTADTNGAVITNTSLKSVATANTNFATGAASTAGWVTTGAGNEKKVYQIQWTFDVTGLTQAQVNALQLATASADFVWEAQNN